MEKVDYIPRKAFVDANIVSIYSSRDKEAANWYHEVIEPSTDNRRTLIADDSNLAYTVFARHNDAIGMRLLSVDPNLTEQDRAIAKKQLDSIISSQTKVTLKKPDRGETPRVVLRVDQRDDVSHYGDSPGTAERRYHEHRHIA